MKYKCSRCPGSVGWNDATKPCFECDAPLEYRVPVGGIKNKDKMVKPKLIELFGEGDRVDEIERRLSAKGFEARRYSQSPYSDAEVVLLYKGRAYTDDMINRLLPRIAPRED